MARPYSGRPVTFEQFEVLMDKVRDHLTAFRNGDIVSKTKARDVLAEFRKTVSALDSACPAVRKFSMDLEKNLVSKNEILDNLGGENSLNQIIQRLAQEALETAPESDPNESVEAEQEPCTGECVGSEGCSE